VPYIEKLKEETWNLELTKQELTLSVTELQQHLHKATSEQTKLAKQTSDLRSDIEQLRDREEKLTALLESSKQRHEQDMTSLRRHCAGLQREAQQHAKHIDTLTSELAIAKAQSRLGKHQSATASGTINNSNSGSNNGANGGQLSSDDSDPSSSHDPHYRSGSSSSLPPSSPKQTPVGGSGGGRTAQAMEFETLKTSLAHAHRMVSNLRSHLHKEKTEKFEFKKLLAESQETIEQLQNDPQLWVDASVSGHGQGGASANGSLEDQKKRKVKQHRRATRKLHRGGLGGNSGGGGGFGGGSGTPPLSSSRSISSKHRGGKLVLWS
jgi:chromosome segregation ATPase